MYLCVQGIMLVYDITQEQTYSNVSKWLRNIEEVRTNLMYMQNLRRYTPLFSCWHRMQLMT